MAGRSIWTTRTFDDRHCFLFGHRIADRVRSEFRDVSVVAGLVWNRDGRRMGPGCIARDGIIANSGAWFVLRNFATRLCFRLSPCRTGLLERLPNFRVARLVRRGRIAGVARYLYSRACAGVTGLGTESRQWQTHEIRSKALRQRTWGVTNLRGPAHDRIQLHVARNSGSLLDFSRKTARLRRQRDIDDHHRLCHRHDLWRHRHRLSFTTMGPSPVHYFVGDLRDAFDSGMGFLAW